MLNFRVRINEKQIRQKLSREAQLLLAKELEVVLLELREATPKDTGEAAASWVLIRRGDEYFFYNPTAHINFLNAGSSQQAPANFIERVLLKHGRPKGSVVTYK